MATRLIAFFIILLSTSCSQGWSIAGWELTPSDSTDVFVNVIDQDSTTHSFRRPVVLDTENWCYRHSIYENISANDK